ncbi:unnamed protein product, partial [Choristocarpus tenellus]
MEDLAAAAAVHFVEERFAEALVLYDRVLKSSSLGNVGCKSSNKASDSATALIFVNRAAAKVQLEMYRSCTRDCDMAISLEPHCLRAYILKGQAFRRLGNATKAQEAFEAGAAVGRGVGDVVLFAELATLALAGRSNGDRGDPINSPPHRKPASGLKEVDDTGSPRGEPSADQIGDQPTNKSDGSLADVSSPSNQLQPYNADSDSADEAGESPSRSVGQESEGGNDGQQEEAGTEEVGGVTGKKKKKKKKKRGKARSEEEGGRGVLKLEARAGGGAVVHGLSQALAESSISPGVLEAARAQLAHGVGDQDIDNVIALGYLQVNTGNYRKAVELFRSLLSIRPGLVGAHLGLGSALALLGGMDSAVASFSAAIE